MKAIILVGGFGTRLRPLTLSVPKPLVPFCNLPILEHQIAALTKVGVDHVILAVGYEPTQMNDALVEMEKKYRVRISLSIEYTPLGTAGPLRLARDLLLDGADIKDSFFMLNSDVTCSFPLEEMSQFHERGTQEGTILVTKVEDPSQYGVVVTDPAGNVERFVEKSKEFVGDRINAGIYILRGAVLDRVEPRPMSIEREIFPVLAAEKTLSSFDLKGFWADLGKPKDLIEATPLFLRHMGIEEAPVPRCPERPRNIGRVLIDPTAQIGAGCVIGPDVCIGEGCVIGEGVRLSKSIVMAGARIGNHTMVEGSIIGWKCNLGDWVRVDGLSVLGKEVYVKEELQIRGSSILPHKELKESVMTPGSVIM